MKCDFRSVSAGPKMFLPLLKLGQSRHPSKGGAFIEEQCHTVVGKSLGTEYDCLCQMRLGHLISRIDFGQVESGFVAVK